MDLAEITFGEGTMPADDRGQSNKRPAVVNLCERWWWSLLISLSLGTRPRANEDDFRPSDGKQSEQVFYSN